MGIIRGHHQSDNQYTQIANSWLRDERLSLKSIGLIAQIMSHTPGWHMSIRSLAKNNNCGVDLIRSAVKELEQFGYLKRSEQKHDSEGKFADFDYITQDPGWSEKPVTVKTRHGKTGHKEEHIPIEEHLVKNTNDFEEFWKAYPKKTDKGAARRAFTTAIKKVDFDNLLKAVQSYSASVSNTEKRYIKNPATWLNAEAWDNETQETKETKGSIWDSIQ